MRHDQRNRERIDQLGDKTRSRMLKAYEQMVKEKLDVCVFETIRTVATQKRYVAEGTSKTMNSYHLVGQAIDLVPYNSKGNPSWDERLYKTPQHKRIVKIMQDNGFRWGYAMWGWDMPHFQYDAIGYGTDTFSGKRPNNVNKPNNSKGGTIYIQDGQTFLNSRSYPKKTSFKPLAVDGFAGVLSYTAGIKVYQWFCSIETDGKFGVISKRNARIIKKGDTREFWVRLLQTMLNFNGAMLAVDGIAGNGTDNAIREFQRAKGLAVDGLAGANTWEQLFKR